MARLTTIKLLGGTRAQLDAAKAASQLIARELYFISDENKIAVGTGVNSYADIGGLQYWKEIAAGTNSTAMETIDTTKGLTIRKGGSAILSSANNAVAIGTAGNAFAAGSIVIGTGNGGTVESASMWGLLIQGAQCNLKGTNNYNCAIINAFTCYIDGWDNPNSIILGAQYSKIYDYSDLALILSGQNSDIRKSPKSTIINGLYNRIAGAQYGTIINGERNLVAGKYASVIGGRMNEAYGESGTVIGGKSNSAVGFASVAMGAGARAIRPGQVAWSSTQQLFGTKPWTGQGQGSAYAMTAHTIGDLSVQMALGDGFSIFNLEPRSIIQFDVQITAFSLDHEAATFRRMFTIKQGATLDSTALVGTVQTIGTDVVEAALDGIGVLIDVDTVRGGLNFSVRGKSGKEIQWTANLITVETKL